MKYKVGDKVQVKSLDWYNKNVNHNRGSVPCGKNYFVMDMTDHCGKIVTISSTYPYGYHIQEDIDGYIWTDEMFEEKDNELIISKEAEALIKFRDFPNLDEDYDIISENCYNPTLYKYCEDWIVDWVDTMGVSLVTFEDKDICNAIDKAYVWLQSNIFKNVTSM